MKKYLSKDSLTAISLWILFTAAIVAVPFFKGGAGLVAGAGFGVSVPPGMVWGFLAISFLMFFYMIYVAGYAFCYKPTPGLSDDKLPGCTVIVPAYNEGKHVEETLTSLLSADYPAEKLEIIAVNDGSQDDTWSWIQHAAAEANGRITTVNLPRNGGKKHALYRGILMAKHDIVVTVDSDSTVNHEGLRSIVSAFADPRVAGAAGNIRIKNLSDGMLPKMMDVGFMFGFEIIRSAQSVIGFVMCTPGALSAYRKSAVLPFLNDWLNQMFLGVPARIGEDRAIATMILQHGYKVVFQSDAIAYTCIPYTYVRFCRMLIRWTRSDIRENWLMLKYVASRLPQGKISSGVVIHLAVQVLNTILPAMLPLLFLTLLVFGPKEVLLSFCYSIIYGLIGALIPAMIYAKRVSLLQSVWALVFSIYGVFALSWVYLYSFLTVRNSKWLTRDLPQQRHSHAGFLGKYLRLHRRKPFPVSESRS